MIYAELKTWSNDHTERKTFYVQAFDAPVSKAQQARGITGYGVAIPVPYRIYFQGKRYRVKCANYGNSGTLYIGKPGEWIATVEHIESMPQRGFKLSSMTDHEFAQFIRQYDLTYKQMLIGNVYSNKSGDSFAVIIFDNAAMTRAIWIKEGLQEFKFRKKEKQSGGKGPELF